MESVRSDAEASFGGRVQDSIQSEVRSRLHSGSETGAQNGKFFFVELDLGQFSDSLKICELLFVLELNK